MSLSLKWTEKKNNLVTTAMLQFHFILFIWKDTILYNCRLTVFILSTLYTTPYLFWFRLLYNDVHLFWSYFETIIVVKSTMQANLNWIELWDCLFKSWHMLCYVYVNYYFCFFIMIGWGLCDLPVSIFFGIHEVKLVNSCMRLSNTDRTTADLLISSDKLFFKTLRDCFFFLHTCAVNVLFKHISLVTQLFHIKTTYLVSLTYLNEDHVYFGSLMIWIQLNS